MNVIRTALSTSVVMLNVAAVEPELQLGPDFGPAAGITLQNAHVDRGALRADGINTHLYGEYRLMNIGLHADAWFMLENDRPRDLDPLEIPEIRLRADYLIEQVDDIQILPYLQYNMYPAYRSDDPLWLGADAWMLMPFEGLELGGHIEIDLTGEHGGSAAFGARQMYQEGNFDLLAWQLLNAGDKDFHRYTLGDPQKSGLTTFELGAKMLTPAPWVDLWFTASAEVHIWIQDADRRARGNDDTEAVFSIGLEYRPE